MNIQALSFMTGQAFSVSATSLMGQSLGKRRVDMAQAYCSRTRSVGFAFSLVLAVVFVFFGSQIVGLYGAWFVMACVQILCSALVLGRYQSGKWKLIKLKNES